MEARYATVAELRRAISTEALVAAGVPRAGPLQTLLRPLVWPPCNRFAHIAAEFDRRVALYGLVEAARWVLPIFVEGTQALGVEHIPATGPLVVASNHPGSYDALLLVETLGRDDLKILVSDVPVLRNAYATSSHFIYTRTDRDAAHSRLGSARESVRHLKEGGALLVYASGQVDPDPALLPGAVEELQYWSPSLPLFVRRVPETKLLVAIVSGVLAPSCFHHPFTRLRKEQRLKQFLAEFIQISQQLLFNRRFPLNPTVRYASPLTASDLGGGQDPQAALETIIEQAEALLADVPSGVQTARGLPVKVRQRL
ncbi:MAG TPA: 1-acyl-sn-glycerol-3-phosphate acyltransferase [Anaerolineae bacterium]|nr:1-acyl-sn-glycerol-3-phosphate acyltransferase [Anaerolineae bacterium]